MVLFDVLKLSFTTQIIVVSLKLIYFKFFFKILNFSKTFFKTFFLFILNQNSLLIYYLLHNNLKKEARFIFLHRKDNTFLQHFIDSMKYPYTPKQLHTLSRKCAVLLLDVFAKIHQARNQYPLITKTSSNGINSYKLPSLA